MTQIKVLGSVMSRASGPQWEPLAPSARQLLAILVAAGPQGLSNERAADEIWPNNLPATWEASLRMRLTRLRRSLPLDSVQSRSGWSRLDVPVDDVDLWRLNDLMSKPIGPSAADPIVSQLAREPYQDVEVSPIIRAAIDEFSLLRSLVLDRLIEHKTVVSPIVATRLRTFADGRDWDATLAKQAAALSANAGAVADVETTAGDRASAVIDQLASQVIDDRMELVALTAELQVDRQALLSGFAAHLRARGWKVVQLHPTAPPASFGPLLQALPELRVPLLAALESTDSPAQVRSRCWTTILQALDDPDCPTCLLVSDADTLDSNSEEALEFIRRSNTANSLTVVVSVADQSTTSSSLVRDAEVEGAVVSAT